MPEKDNVNTLVLLFLTACYGSGEFLKPRFRDQQDKPTLSHTAYYALYRWIIFSTGARLFCFQFLKNIDYNYNYSKLKKRSKL